MLKSRNGLYPERFLPPFFAASGFFAILVYGIVATNLTLDLIFDGGRVSWLFGHHPTAFIGVLVGLPFCLVYILPVFAFNRGAIGNAAFLLGEIRNPATLLPLIESFSRMGMNRVKIAQALTRYGSTAVPLLRAQLRHRNAAVRRGCIEALGMLKAAE